MFEKLLSKDILIVVDGGKRLFGVLLSEDALFIQIKFLDGNTRFISKSKILDLKELDKKTEGVRV